MELKGILYFFIIMLGIFMLVIYLKQKRPLKTAAISVTTGLAGMLTVWLTSAYTGISIALNIFTVSVAVVLGLPGVISLLLCNLM